MSGDHAPAVYPPPPWRLVGPAVVASRLIEIDRVRPFVPEDLDIVAVRPGRTTAALVVADYQHQSSFPYSELSVMPALVRYRGVRGAWISHIWVDSMPSLRGGREMWGMYKHLATFQWQVGATNQVSVAAEDAVLATLTWPAPKRLWPVPGRIHGIGSVNGDRRRFTGRGLSRLGRTSIDVHVAASSPFSGLGLQDGASRGAAGRMNLSFGDIRILAPPNASPSRSAPAV